MTKKLQILGSFGSDIKVDSTLTQDGFAADAKATGDAINQVQTNIDGVASIIENLNDKYYTEAEIDNMISDITASVDAKSDSDHNHDNVYYTETEIDAKLATMQSGIDSKVDAVDGMGLSSNDYTTSEKDKLATIEANANFYEHPTHVSHTSGLYKVTVDEFGHVSGATLAEKEDIVALGIPEQDTTYDTEISDLSDRIDGVENDIQTTNETLSGVSQEFESYKTTNNEAVSANATNIEANKTAIEVIQEDYLTSADKIQLQDNITQVSNKATENASAIEVLNGEGDGSVKQSIDNAFNEFASNVTNDNVVNTYKELIDYAATHSAEFVELVGEVDTLKTDVNGIETDLSDYKTTVADQFTEVNATIDDHVNNFNNPHGVTKEQIGLDMVDNTSDVEKPISNATQEALDGKADVEHAHEVAEVNGLQGLIDELLSYNEQFLTDEQKMQARLNIGAGEPQVQADWNQNDDTAADYINNRPFYEDTVLVEVLPETTVELVDDDGMFMAEAPIDSSVTLEAGTECVINWNGVEYTSKAYILDGCIALGDASLITGQESTQEPFLIGVIPDYLIMIIYAFDATAAGETRTFSISGITNNIYKIDAKYMPDGYPYYKNIDNPVSIDEETYEFANDGDYVTASFSLIPTVGMTYNVTWDGTTYECVAYNIEGISVIGNGLLINYSGGNNEPFFINSFNGTHIKAQEAGSHTISIKSPTVEVHKIDEEFLPDSFVRKEDLNIPSWALEETKPSYTPEEVGAMPEIEAGEVGQYVRVKSVDDNGKPTEYEATEIELPNNIAKDYLMLIDTENSYEYFIQMKNGELTSVCRAASIEVIKMPNKVDYTEGDAFVSDGMALRILRKDGSFDDITNYQYDGIVLDNPFVVTYSEFGIEYTTSIKLNIKYTTLTKILKDFNYTDNGDETYTITNWKGTLDGEESTEIVVPDSDIAIIL